MHHPLRNTSTLALVVSFFAAVAFFVAFSTATGDAPSTCRWCESNAFDETVRSLLFAQDPRSAARLSHVISLGVGPMFAMVGAVIPALGARRVGDALRNFFIVVTAFVLTTGIADGVKKLAERERPGFHHGRAALLEAANTPLERHLSFFSGDTAWSFLFVAVGLTLARLRGYPTPRWLYAVGAALAVLGGVLRVVADMHWATDVLAGAAVGTCVGVGLPSLVHRRAPA